MNLWYNVTYYVIKKKSNRQNGILIWKKTKKAYEIVIDSIKEQIMNQELVLGQGLPPEREISEKLGVSRNSVREALKILTVMGVVSSRQGAGNYISGNFKGYMVDALSMMFM